MRNIKTSLRFVRNSALLFVAASGVTYLAGCQSENGLNPDQEIIEPSSGTGTYSVYASNPNRVRNYDNGGTRAAGENTLAGSFKMPTKDEALAAASAALSIKDVEYDWQLDNAPYKGGSVLVDKDFGRFFNSEATKYYIKEGVTVDFSTGFSGFAAGSEVYVLPGAKFKVGVTLPPGLTVYNYGYLEIPAGLTVSGDIYSAVDVDATGEVGIDGKFYSRGTLMADSVRLNGETAACAFVADKIRINSQGTVQTTYLEADTIVMNAGKVKLEKNGLVWAKTELNPTNTESKLTAVGGKALVYAENIKTSDSTMGSHIPDIFEDANVWVVYNAFNLNNDVIDALKDKTGSHIYHVSQVSDEGKDGLGNTIKVSSDGTCHKTFGFTGDPEKPFGEIDDPKDEDPKEPEDPDFELIPVADIENPDAEDELKHDHGEISATCISFGGNGVAFASFHRRGNEDSDYNQGYETNKGHKGCIEKIVYEGGKFALKSFMIAPEWDFNHILADGNRVITVGNHVKKGAFIAALPFDFEASTGVSEQFSYKELTTDEPLYGTSDKTGEEIKKGYKNAGDGNCVVRVGDLYYVTTFRGYGALKTDFSKGGKFTPTNGSSKHIALDGNGKMAIISLDEYNKTKNESLATIKEFATSDFEFANPSKDYKAGANVAPIDGKNTIAYSGSDLFACLGHGGLSKNGEKFYQRGEKVPVNGVTVVGNYIFVANGSFLDVLDLQGNRLCHYHDKNLHSSNYVAVDTNGFIYVAFGKSDIKIFKLGGKKVAENWHIAGK